MKLIEPSVRQLIYEPTLEGAYKAIAESAYICYATDPEVAKLTPKEFIDKILIPNDHARPLEFGTIYLKVPWCSTYETTQLTAFFRNNPYSKVKFFSDADDPSWLITTNYRVINEHKLFDELEMYYKYTDLHPKRYMAEFVCSRGASDDFRTHVTISSIAESTRYCLYSKDKFGNELTFVEPYWVDIPAQEIHEFTIESFKLQEKMYLDGAKLGMRAEQLKRILPMGVKTTLRLCGFKDAWDNFFYRRCDHHADYECQCLAKEIKSIFNF